MSFLNFLIPFLLLSNFSKRSLCQEHADWGYKTNQTFKSPSQWKDIPGSSCGGRRQSPLNIVKESTQYWSSLLTLKFENTTKPDGKVNFAKDNTTIRLEFSDKWVFRFGSVGCLKPVNIHWHWGSIDTQGSEHTINGQRFPIEAHIVCYNCDLYSNFNSAFSGPSGLYAISLLYNLGQNNTAIDKIIPYFQSLESKNVVPIDEIRPDEFLGVDLSKYYRYEGSLTTPLCTENVLWTVMHDNPTIGKSQLEQFRNFTYLAPEFGKMMDNFRPTIPNVDSPDYIRRVIYSSFISSSNVPKNSIFIYTSIVVGVLMMY